MVGHKPGELLLDVIPLSRKPGGQKVIPCFTIRGGPGVSPFDGQTATSITRRRGRELDQDKRVAARSLRGPGAAQRGAHFAFPVPMALSARDGNDRRGSLHPGGRVYGLTDGEISMV